MHLAVDPGSGDCGCAISAIYDSLPVLLILLMEITHVVVTAVQQQCVMEWSGAGCRGSNHMNRTKISNSNVSALGKRKEPAGPS